MRVLMINNDGAGFADFIDIEAGTTVEQLFTQQVKSGRPNDYLIRVNRLPSHREQNDTLCEGEGRVPIERALRQGRLFDFFLIVRQILDNYNPESAYVRITDWHGLTCQDCGSSMDEEERDTCFGCETDLCNDCSNGCQRCSERFCNDCTESCEVCHEYYCQACLQRCDECELLYCEDCQTHEKCPNCVEKQEAEAEKFNPASNAPVHAVCVGEAAVPS